MAFQQENNKRASSLAALAEAEDVARRIHEQLAERTLVQGITIDNPSSLDLDDAFWIERLPQGGYQLEVSIAEVGAWITAHQTPTLDRAAFRRAFTRYERHRYHPMLPKSLSEDRLSLLEGCLRPAITITVLLDAQLRLSSSSIAQTALRSSKRLSYDAVERELDHPQTTLAPLLHLAYELAQGLFHARRLRGALAAYDLPTGWFTTEDGLLRAFGAEERPKAQFITAEFMILANQAFAHFFASRGIPALYRNQKATAVAPERFALLQLLDAAMLHPTVGSAARVRATFQLAMERARYAPTVEGHFGLNLPAYVHMTSPIRRYPDLVNQRILLAVLNGEDPPYHKEELEQIAEAVNRREQEMRDARDDHFLGLHDRHIATMVARDGKDETAPNQTLTSLDAKTFHSVIRITGESKRLFPALEQEILRRLEARQLYAHDLFTLLFRFNTSGAAWERVKAAALHALAKSPEHAPSMLLMGQHALGWSSPIYEFSSAQGEQASFFQARASVSIAGREYVSSWQQAAQKSRAKQLASADVLLQIARKNSKAVIASAEPPEHLCNDASQPSESFPPVISGDPVLPNYKGHLLEVAQARHGVRPVYVERARSGPSHAPLFSVEGTVVIHGNPYSACGEGTTKAQAEQSAAQKILQLLPAQPAKTPPPIARAAPQPARSALHALQQKALVKSITYAYERSGREHDGVYTCICTVLTADDQPLAETGTGTTKRQAAQEAAARMLARLA